MNLKNVSMALVVSILFIGITATKLSAKLKVGKTAPDFTLKDELGNARTLKEFRGKTVVLYFFPYANSTLSPHCTKQACNFNSDLVKFTENDIVVLGVSFDEVKDLKKFKNKNHLGFTLLSDHDKKIAKKYGAYTWWFPLFPNRKTIIIDKIGKVQKIMKNVDAASNARDVLTALGIN